MSRESNIYGNGLFAPTREQAWLLKAALTRGPGAIAAWQKWKPIKDMDHLDPGSTRMLPLVYDNLSRQGVDEPLLNTCKGFYRRAFYQNNMLFHRMAPLLDALETAKIPTMLLKGAALVCRYYKKPGLRPMDDLDILVPTHRALDAVSVLKRLGWRQNPKPKAILAERYFNVRNGHEFNAPDGQAVDLHWHLLADGCFPGADAPFWEAAVSSPLAGAGTLALCATDQLIHVCVHGAKWNIIPGIRWVADAMHVLDTEADRIDWGRLARLAGEFRISLPLLDTLGYLKDRFEAPVPAPILDRLKALHRTWGERREYRDANSPAGLGMRSFMLRYLRHRSHSRNAAPQTGTGGLGLLAFTQHFFGADSGLDMLCAAGRRATERIRHLGGRHRARTS